MPAPFAPPDFWAPLDVEAIVEKIPASAKVKGMFFHAVQDQARKRGLAPIGRAKYIAFQDYEVREHAHFLVDSAKAIYPEQPVRQGLRQLGRDAYRVFLDSMLGKVIFSVAARRFEAALALTSKAYKVVGNLSSATLEDEQPSSAVVHLRGVWNFPDCYHVGVFEEAAVDYGRKAEILVRVNSPEDVELKLTW